MTKDGADGARFGEVFAAGLTSLLVELAFLRFLPGQIRVLGYFTNFVLLAAFVGLGIGMMASRRLSAPGKVTGLAPLGFLVLVGAAWLGRGLGIGSSADEVLVLEYQTPSGTNARPMTR